MLINDETKKNIFIDAIEGSINYWAFVYGYDSENFTAIIGDKEAEDDTKYVIDLGTITKGINALIEMNYAWCKERLSNILTEDYDAEDCDIVIQLGIFGEVIYG